MSPLGRNSIPFPSSNWMAKQDADHLSPGDERESDWQLLLKPQGCGSWSVVGAALWRRMGLFPAEESLGTHSSTVSLCCKPSGGCCCCCLLCWGCFLFLTPTVWVREWACICLQAAITKHRKLGGFNNTDLFSYSTRGWKSKIMV